MRPAPVVAGLLPLLALSPAASGFSATGLDVRAACPGTVSSAGAYYAARAPSAAAPPLSTASPACRRLRSAHAETALSTATAAEGDDSSSGEGTATIPAEIFNLVKSIVGAGVLSLPAGIAAFASSPSAIVPAAALIASIGGLSAYTFSMIARVCKNTGATSYADAWDRTRGTKTAWIVAMSSALDCVAGNLSYSMILADTFKDLLAAGGIAATRTNALLGVTSLILLPLCLVKNLSSLAPFSLVGIMGMLYTGLAIGIRYFGGAYAMPAGKFVSDLAPHLQPSFGTVGASGVLGPQSLILVCMLSTAYIAHFNAPKFYRELKNNTMKRFNTVVTASFGLSVALYVAVASMGFLTFGSACQGLILNNYSTKDALVGLSRFAVALSLVFSYPLLFVGGRDGILDLAKVPESDRSNSLQNKVTLAMLGVITALAARLHDLTFVSSISGAVFGTALIFVYPPLMFRNMVKNMGERAGRTMQFEKKMAKFTAALGVIIGLIGTKMACGSVSFH
uniref:Amino acid transporter transmembrane domain-containing protein n=1 Tax=Trieres chinensis TaxID=1514140 RepID=A0A7S2ESF5_TRICV|eukprot:CAMPEP_0183296116 /NCGR_PEP_ID=MMETSP0160_2-20130417/3811_1 /TAXON_ID=2839 ORGANISM="Odontella Sinensis, Strain Grunow 1884" /NCGR_SAMPLE_ID=MMETSP0160_2 /ASSEMBLY_ACC=CAM_ASM_000250 /LENGTH=508 /DNA_ID=CAMNT_0025457695 /DNA_START=49 /DNA_END=1575 /DNA_ORIENTATION=+